jgi:hypothetical protein
LLVADRTEGLRYRYQRKQHLLSSAFRARGWLQV